MNGMDSFPESKVKTLVCVFIPYISLGFFESLEETPLSSLLCWCSFSSSRIPPPPTGVVRLRFEPRNGRQRSHTLTFIRHSRNFRETELSFRRKWVQPSYHRFIFFLIQNCVNPLAKKMSKLKEKYHKDIYLFSLILRRSRTLAARHSLPEGRELEVLFDTFSTLGGNL